MYAALTLRALFLHPPEKLDVAANRLPRPDRANIQPHIEVIRAIMREHSPHSVDGLG